MTPEITQALADIERDHGVRIVHAVESGSRVWGFASQDSDYDVRFLYVRPQSWYLSAFERADTLGPFFYKGKLIDVDGWDLKKALALLFSGNPPLFEWLNSPVVYRTDDDIMGLVRLVAPKYFNARSAIYHYLHMADGNFQGYLKHDVVRTKKYFYVLRPLLCCMWIHRTHQAPPLAWDELVVEADWGTDVGRQVAELLERKRSGSELGDGPRLDAVNAWIEAKLVIFAEAARTTARTKGRGDDLDAVLFHATRGRPEPLVCNSCNRTIKDPGVEGVRCALCPID